MADLKCGAENCTYNQNHLCCKGDICVGVKNASCSDETCCESFMVRKDENSYKNSTCHVTNTISIDCEAEKCMYNSNYKCTASHVDIRGCHACDCRETACDTFREA